MVHWVYILESETSGRYYVGQTDDVARRLAYHNRGLSRSTRGRGPWKLMYKEKSATRSEACRREREIKGWRSRVAIERLIASGHSRGVAQFG